MLSVVSAIDEEHDYRAEERMLSVVSAVDEEHDYRAEERMLSVVSVPARPWCCSTF